jgi:hypothetical protein
MDEGWAWENYWLIFATIAYLISWLLALATVPQLAQVYAATEPATFAKIPVFDLPGDLGRLTFGLGCRSGGSVPGLRGHSWRGGIGWSGNSANSVNPPQHITTAQIGPHHRRHYHHALPVGVPLLGRQAGSPRRKKERQSYASRNSTLCWFRFASSCGNLGFVSGRGSSPSPNASAHHPICRQRGVDSAWRYRYSFATPGMRPYS